ncbi:amidohydrolase [Knoellia aerolata]|uniref:Metal-dependent hydrolase n=1 Tax=Knoellia aerolata DSM 18566 TaxID=1385519 RepID=A0A0A0JW37_9MICO|nr:amidohydrolase family protein [Knoellia aerolata]KGN41408.1 metal-dependent hydrolase [Knoellia aerolata DSM 18566]
MSSLFIRQARLVPVAGRPAPEGIVGVPVDVRVEADRVVEVAPTLRPTGADQVLEAEGRWLVPGLWDQHVHMGQWAANATRLDLSSTSSAGEVVRIVAAEIGARSGRAPGTVLQGFGHRTAGWERQPTVSELDAVSGEVPVVLISGDAHHGWLNSAAQRLLGVAPRDTVVEENEWFPVFARLDEVTRTPEGGRTAYAKVLDAALRRGVVGVRDMEWADNATEWVERSGSGLAVLRVRTATYAVGLADAIAAGRRSGDVLDEAGLVTMGPLKIISDGSLNTRTAYCHDPYVGDDVLEHPRGRANNSPEELADLLAQATAHGLDVAVHAIGDAAVGIALDAFTATGAAGSIEHAQLVALPDLGRMARLGVVASVQPAHLIDDRDVTHQCWPDRADRCFPLRSMLRAGVTLALGSDAPVAPLDPWEAMAAAVHRTGDDREEWNAQETITVTEALAGSLDGAPTVGAGSLADLALLDADPYAAGESGPEAAAHLRSLEVSTTVVGGRVFGIV